MFPVLLIVTAWTVSFMQTHPLDATHTLVLRRPNKSWKYNHTTKTEKLKLSKQELDIEKMTEVLLHKLLKHPQLKLRHSRIVSKNKSDIKKRSNDEEMDMIYRADHVSQFVADMFVNTDDEITALQVTEPDEENQPGKNDYSDMEFYNFLIRRAINDTIYLATSEDPALDTMQSTTLD